jgi:hypothetical protein
VYLRDLEMVEIASGNSLFHTLVHISIRLSLSEALFVCGTISENKNRKTNG